MLPTYRPNPSVLAVAFLALIQSGCAVLIGNVDPISERSGDYEVTDLSETDGEWSRLEPEAVVESGESDLSEDEQEIQTSDLTFQSERTASIISLNSACRERIRESGRSLSEYTDLLLLGMSSIRQRNEAADRVAGLGALRTVVEGRMGGEAVKVQTVVLRKGRCIYDLMYVAKPENYEEELSSFDRFVSSLRIH